MLKAHPKLSSIDGASKQLPMLSAVVPTFNESANIDVLIERLIGVFNDLAIPFEIICVDDGSSDDTALRISEWHRRHEGIKLVRFSRNFGKEAALNAGLAHSSGDAVIQLDADLQHPPEIIKTFFKKWQDGSEIVYGKRKSRQKESLLRRFMAKAFYRVFAAVSNVKLMEGLGDFILLDRKVVDALLALPERERFTKGLYAWVGFKREAVPFEVAERAGGQSGFNYRRLFHFAMDAITAFGSMPLKIWSVIGFMMAASAMTFGAFIVLQKLIFGIDVPGYPSLMAALCFFAGVQLIGLGIVGEYLSRVLMEVKQRPLYLVQERVGFEEDEERHYVGPLPLERVAS